MSTQLLQQHIDIINTKETVDDVTNWIIGLGKTHAVANSKNLRIKDNYISGCKNPLWLSASCSDNQCWTFEVDSDSFYVMGMSKIVIDRFNGHTESEIKHVSFQDFRDIVQKLPVQRQRGVQQIINRIRQCVNSVD
jgi:sulfur transfer protein SufE